MLHEPSPATIPTSEDRETRRQRILQALRDDPLLERLADELADLPDDEVFGPIEHALRDLSHDLAAKAHRAGIDAGKKRGTQAPASSARAARPTPASSAAAQRPG